MFLLFAFQRVLTTMYYWHKERNFFLYYSLGFMNLVSLLLKFLPEGNKTNIDFQSKYLKERCHIIQERTTATINNPQILVGSSNRNLLSGNEMI